MKYQLLINSDLTTVDSINKKMIEYFPRNIRKKLF